MSKKFTPKPLTIEALQFDGKNFEEILKFTNGNTYWISLDDKKTEFIYVKTPYGIAQASADDWVIREIGNTFRVCKSNIFCNSYDEM
jgi:hypothetical protein